MIFTYKFPADKRCKIWVDIIQADVPFCCVYRLLAATIAFFLLEPVPAHYLPVTSSSEAQAQMTTFEP